MRFLFLSLVTLFISANLQAQMFEPVKWKMSYEHISGDEYMLTYKANMENPWTLYSQFTSDDGPVPTTITYETKGFEKVGESEELGHKKQGMDKMFGVEVIKFLSDQPFTIKQKVKAPAGTEISGYLTYMTCDNERCLPPTDVDFSFKLEGGAAPAPKSEPKTTTAPAGTSVTKPVKEKAPTKIVETVTKSAPVKKAASTIGAVTGVATEPIKSTINKATTKAAETVKESAPTSIKTNEPSTPIKIGGGVDLGSANETSEPAPGVFTPVTWDLGMKALGNDEYEIVYTATAQDPWTVYSQFTSDDGPVPTEITYETEGVNQVGKGTEEGHKKEGMDKMFGVEVIKFLSDKPFVITHKIKTSAEKIKGYLTYMTCDDTRCLPPTDVNFAFDLKTGKQLDYDDFADAVVAPVTAPGLTSGAGPSISGNILDNRIPTITASYTNPIGNCKGGEEQTNSLFKLFIFGLIGGLIALLTPCVFLEKRH